jgi:hypothetical protein
MAGIPVTWAGIVCNHAAFLVALIGVHRLATRHCSRTATNLAVWLVALGPLSFLFSMLYPSALFLAASVWAFVWVEEHRDLAAGVAAAVAALSRPNGVVVLVALVIGVGFSLRRMLRIALPVVGVLAGWIWYNAVRTGDPMRFLDAKRAWSEVTIIGFVNRPTPNALLHVGVAAIALTLVLLVRRRIPSSWTWYTILYLAPSLVLGMVGLARYATDTFPPAVAGGIILDGHRSAQRRVFALLILAQIGFAFYFIADGRLI